MKDRPKKIQAAAFSRPKKKGKRKMPKSSSSNPSSNKFREAAKHTFRAKGQGIFTTSSSKSTPSSLGGLTLEALEKHNEATGGFTEASLGQDDAATTFGNQTANTWATNMTGCTNITFNRVHRYINANSPLHKEILAVLAAITEVIKEKGGQGSDVQYFATLVSSLEEADKMETMTAMAHLLSIVIKRVPVAILQKQFSQVVKTLAGIITRCSSEKETTAPLKPTLLSLASLLRVVDANTWAEPSTQHAYKALLLFISHSKPKLRKAAHTAVKIVLRGSLMMQQEKCPLPYHPAAPVTAQWCIDTIESARGQAQRVEILHNLSLLKDIMSYFPYKSVKSGCEILLKLMTLTDLVIRSSCLEVLFRLFSAKPDGKTVPAEMNAQIIMALHDHQPSEKDSQPMMAWIRVMEAATVNLASQDIHLCAGHLPRLFSTCMTCLLSDRPDVAKAAVSTMKVLLLQCVEPLGVSKGNDSALNQSLTAIQKVVKSLEMGLSYQFHSTWALVLNLWSTVFTVMGKLAPKMLMKCLSSMGDLRDTPHFSYKAEMDQAIGSAVKSMGPRSVLEAIPLGISGENDNLEFPRGWLIPVIRDNVTRTELGFFSSYFLPLAATCKEKAVKLSNEKRIAEAKAYDALQLQFWSMLKGFCDHPTDLKQSFQGVAKTLGTALNEREDLRMGVMAALRSLISCSLENDKDKKEIARFAKNYLPILFNLFTGEGVLIEPTRLAVLETVKKYLMVADTQLVHTFFNSCMDKMKEGGEGTFKNIALLDLAIAMIPYADLTQLDRIFELSVPHLQSEDRTVQKKSYRVLEEICSGQTECSRELLASNLDTVSKTLLESLSKSSPSSKAPRLRCLIHVYKNLKESNMEFFMNTLPEAIMCTKEIGMKARAAAFELIIVMCEKYIQWNSARAEKESLEQFVTKLLAGLAGSPHMISATLLALTRILFHYKDRLSGNVLDQTVDSVCLLLASKTREVIKTSLGFIKVLLSAFENTTLAAHLKNLLDGLHEIAVKGNMRRLTKIIYQKLIRKFGYELIVSMTKVGVHKLLKNIHKSQERAKRKTEGETDEVEDDEDENEEDKTTSQPESIEDLLRDTDSELDDDDREADRKKQKKGKKSKQGKDAWLMETGEDEIVDFMDPSVAKQVRTSKPKSKSVGKEKSDPEKDRGFKMSADGRLIITKDEDDREAAGNDQGSDEDDDLDDLFDAYEGVVKNKSRKRKRDAMGDFDDDEDEGGKPSASKYKAGGSGIHRPIATARKRSDELGQEYQSKKAKGDMKKKGRPDPYAYVPLNFGNLNKRKQMKVKGAFNNLVKGARKGAAKGLKTKDRKGKALRGKRK